MSNREIFIGLPELDILIQALEEKYGISTAEFVAIRDERIERIEEDDVFKWEAYVAHRDELWRANREIRDSYLSNLKSQANQAKPPAPEDQFLLAA